MSLVNVIKPIILGQFIHIKMLEGLKFQHSSSYLTADAYTSVNKGLECYIAVWCLNIFTKSVNPQTVFNSASMSVFFYFFHRTACFSFLYTII